ncbi:hypothetical protein GCM10011428_49730 [Streptomyces violaceus]
MSQVSAEDLEWVRPGRFGVDCDVYTNRKALVPHRHAPLTETDRLRVALLRGRRRLAAVPGRRAVPGLADHSTVGGDRYRKLGAAGMSDRSSRPHHSPGRVLARYKPARLAHPGWATGRVIRRYERWVN